ncbi:alpha/beta fold hydrolase [Altererythrobacter sp. GH1-8]|uniref:alpha/beta fold hydrolase n=1 Tax=Altererythrobacter sp. GH1-8 TaxID=3349333 RepID=UPI00374CD20C
MTLQIRKAYADLPAGQLHYRVSGRGGVPLVCLAPAPFSGLAFANILPLLGKSRAAFAPDYPGYGGSDEIAECSSIADYAAAMLAFCKAILPGQKIDVLGFHSGCLVAAEMALQAGPSVREIVLIDVPAFEPEQRKRMARRFVGERYDTEELGALESLWDRAVVSRRATQPIGQRLALFAEMVARGEGLDRMFEAAFSYSVEERFAALTLPVSVIATNGSLKEPTHRAASLLPAANLSDCDDISGSVLDAHAAQTAAVVDAVLNS